METKNFEIFKTSWVSSNPKISKKKTKKYQKIRKNSKNKKKI